MARTYAGVLGLLAFAVVTARSALNDGPLDRTILAAIGGMLTYAIIGLVLGRVAQFVIDDSVRGELTLAMQDSTSQKRKNTTSIPPARDSESSAINRQPA